jgi:hypothetical protein
MKLWAASERKRVCVCVADLVQSVGIVEIANNILEHQLEICYEVHNIIVL